MIDIFLSKISTIRKIKLILSKVIEIQFCFYNNRTQTLRILQRKRLKNIFLFYQPKIRKYIIFTIIF